MCEKSSTVGGKPRSLWRILHDDERGGVSLETVLILAAVALPILIFVIKFAWPGIKEFFDSQMIELKGGSEGARAGS